MKNLYYYICISLLLIFGASSNAYFAQDQTDNDIQQKQVSLATEFINQLNANEYEISRQNFDKKMLSALDTKNLQTTWETLNVQAGQYKEILHTEIKVKGEYSQIISSSQFKNAIVDIIVVLDKKNKIAGLFFKPSNYKAKESPAKKAKSVTQSQYWSQEQVEFGDAEWRLPGTVTYPKNVNAAPLVILVHGSGPNDRDETIGPNKPFRDIAHGLAEQGIASLRYDKRTLVHGQKLVEKMAELTTYQETTDDVLHAVEFAQTLKNINSKKIFVLGHSLGGMLIPRIAEKGPSIAGFIMLAAPARPMEDLIIEQYNYIFQLDGELSDEEKAIIDTLDKQVDNVKKLSYENNVAPNDLPLGLHQTYWLDLNSYNITESAKNISKPLFITQGARDYQVLATKDFALWKAALKNKENVEFKLYPALNHLMITGENASTPQEYSEKSEVDKNFIQDMANWIMNN